MNAETDIPEYSAEQVEKEREQFRKQYPDLFPFPRYESRQKNYLTWEKITEFLGGKSFKIPEPEPLNESEKKERAEYKEIERIFSQGLKKLEKEEGECTDQEEIPESEPEDEEPEPLENLQEKFLEASPPTQVSKENSSPLKLPATQAIKAETRPGPLYARRFLASSKRAYSKPGKNFGPIFLPLDRRFSLLEMTSKKSNQGDFSNREDDDYLSEE